LRGQPGQRDDGAAARAHQPTAGAEHRDRQAPPFVLVNAHPCRLLVRHPLRLAEAEAYRPLWSSYILAELRRNVVEAIEAGIPVDRVDRRITHMSQSFPDAMVTGYESLIDSHRRYDQ